MDSIYVTDQMLLLAEPLPAMLAEKGFLLFVNSVPMLLEIMLMSRLVGVALH